MKILINNHFEGKMSLKIKKLLQVPRFKQTPCIAANKIFLILIFNHLCYISPVYCDRRNTVDVFFKSRKIIIYRFSKIHDVSLERFFPLNAPSEKLHPFINSKAINLNEHASYFSAIRYGLIVNIVYPSWDQYFCVHSKCLFSLVQRFSKSL